MCSPTFVSSHLVPLKQRGEGLDMMPNKASSPLGRGCSKDPIIDKRRFAKICGTCPKVPCGVVVYEWKNMPGWKDADELHGHGKKDDRMIDVVRWCPTNPTRVWPLNTSSLGG